MKASIKMVVFCLLLGGLWTVPVVLAADLPDLGEAAPPAVNKHPNAAESMNRDAVCTKCHDESELKPILSIYQTKHGVKGDPRTPSCQSCHGDSEDHVKNTAGKATRNPPDIVFTKGSYAVTDTKQRAGQCLTCHKGTNRTYWGGGQHENSGMACNDCHKIHQPVDKLLSRKTQTQVCFACHKEQRADSHKISTHPIDVGKVVCSDCHNPHGSTAPKLLKFNTVNETCWSCHADKRGPFLWEHQPVSENCTNCHTPHGSNITPLLKSRPPFLCDECHDGPHNSQAAYGPMAAGIQGGNGLIANGTNPKAPNTNAVGRACMNCHVMVHGSNSPAGAFLHR